VYHDLSYVLITNLMHKFSVFIWYPSTCFEQ